MTADQAGAQAGVLDDAPGAASTSAARRPMMPPMIARRPWHAVALVALVALAPGSLAACSSSSDDPFTADMKMICRAGQGSDHLPPELRRVEALREIAERIRTPEAARLLATLMQVAPAERGPLVAEALARAGLRRCPFLEP